MKRIMPALAAALAAGTTFQMSYGGAYGNPRLTDRFGKPFAAGALPDIGCYECQEKTPYKTLILMQ